MRDKRIIMAGDSMIQYCDWQEFFPEHEIINEGLSGETVEELRTRVRGITDRHAAPAVIVIMIGTNNVAMERFSFLPAYQDILDTIRGKWPGTRVAVNSLLPMNLYYLGQDAVKDVNDLLRRLAQSNGAVFIDAWSAMVDENGAALSGVLADEVHLTRRGYGLWVETLRPFFKNAVPS